MGRIDESKLFVGLGLPGPKNDVVSSGFWAFAYVRGEILLIHSKTVQEGQGGLTKQRAPTRTVIDIFSILFTSNWSKS